MSGWTSRLAHGLAHHLAEHGIGTYRPDGVYREDETGIVIATVPAAPPRVVALTPYPVADALDQADSVLGLQVRCRSSSRDPREAFDLADSVFGLFAGASHLDLDGVLVHLVERTASGPIGRDANGRAEHADTYRLTCHHPTRHRS
ncbi:minor capsid protein [Saccharopolyspora shandongensis]|uniref:minor capsid protein n=1 Tax=Saccharopolyspora shandongensis TaxID=418495 RepID=UPI0033ED10F3